MTETFLWSSSNCGYLASVSACFGKSYSQNPPSSFIAVMYRINDPKQTQKILPVKSLHTRYTIENMLQKTNLANPSVFSHSFKVSRSTFCETIQCSHSSFRPCWFNALPFTVQVKWRMPVPAKLSQLFIWQTFPYF